MVSHIYIDWLCQTGSILTGCVRLAGLESYYCILVYRHFLHADCCVNEIS
jgi:hypothetical protein